MLSQFFSQQRFSISDEEADVLTSQMAATIEEIEETAKKKESFGLVEGERRSDWIARKQKEYGVPAMQLALGAFKDKEGNFLATGFVDRNIRAVYGDDVAEALSNVQGTTLPVMEAGNYKVAANAVRRVMTGSEDPFALETIMLNNGILPEDTIRASVIESIGQAKAKHDIESAIYQKADKVGAVTSVLNSMDVNARVGDVSLNPKNDGYALANEVRAMLPYEIIANGITDSQSAVLGTLAHNAIQTYAQQTGENKKTINEIIDDLLAPSRDKDGNLVESKMSQALTKAGLSVYRDLESGSISSITGFVNQPYNPFTGERNLFTTSAQNLNAKSEELLYRLDPIAERLRSEGGSLISIEGLIDGEMAKNAFGVAARPDFIKERDGEFDLYDLKSSSAAAEHSLLQQLIYASIINERAKKDLEEGVTDSKFAKFGELLPDGTFKSKITSFKGIDMFTGKEYAYGINDTVSYNDKEMTIGDFMPILYQAYSDKVEELRESYAGGGSQRAKEIAEQVIANGALFDMAGGSVSGAHRNPGGGNGNPPVVPPNGGGNPPVVPPTNDGRMNVEDQFFVEQVVKMVSDAQDTARKWNGKAFGLSHKDSTDAEKFFGSNISTLKRTIGGIDELQGLFKDTEIGHYMTAARGGIISAWQNLRHSASLSEAGKGLSLSNDIAASIPFINGAKEQSSVLTSLDSQQSNLRSWLTEYERSMVPDVNNKSGSGTIKDTDANVKLVTDSINSAIESLTQTRQKALENFVQKNAEYFDEIISSFDSDLFGKDFGAKDARAVAKKKAKVERDKIDSVIADLDDRFEKGIIDPEEYKKDLSILFSQRNSTVDDYDENKQNIQNRNRIIDGRLAALEAKKVSKEITQDEYDAQKAKLEAQRIDEIVVARTGSANKYEKRLTDEQLLRNKQEANSYSARLSQFENSIYGGVINKSQYVDSIIAQQQDRYAAERADFDRKVAEGVYTDKDGNFLPSKEKEEKRLAELQEALGDVDYQSALEEQFKAQDGARTQQRKSRAEMINSRMRNVSMNKSRILLEILLRLEFISTE